ncbi:hypothetical protein [Onishia taeanensis]
MSVKIRNAYYIKMGRQGKWEKEAIDNGELLFGYHKIPIEICKQGKWEEVKKACLKERQGKSSTATSDTRQIRTFHEADESDVFITFYDNCLYWCRPTGEVEDLGDGHRRRETVDGWHSKTTTEEPLTTDRISGTLLKIQGFRGTICKVKPKDYLIRKISGIDSPEVAASIEAETALTDANIKLMRLLSWQDFELLVDLIFSSSGWRRVGVMGKTQKNIDLELLLPTTGERAFVQIKSSTHTSHFIEYWNNHQLSNTFQKMFFVWHTGSVEPPPNCDAILVGPARLGRMVVDAGLSSWLRQKVS